ncbi:MAG: DUF3592 domain-containing protein [Cyclobacteriaceae bacterium]|nr:DUF3592 domain-containing protein [Cyclobacteriaceae bacterium]
MNGELLILAISLVLIVVGVLLWQKGNHLLATGKKAKAIVFKNNYNAGVGRDGGVYYPVVRFLTDKQEWITQELSVGYDPAIEEGTELEIIYDPDDPTTVEINSSFQLEVLPRLLIAIGICGLVFGFLELLEITQIMGD